MSIESLLNPLIRCEDTGDDVALDAEVDIGELSWLQVSSSTLMQSNAGKRFCKSEDLRAASKEEQAIKTYAQYGQT
jgi:hypothetical protein